MEKKMMNEEIVEEKSHEKNKPTTQQTEQVPATVQESSDNKNLRQNEADIVAESEEREELSKKVTSTPRPSSSDCNSFSEDSLENRNIGRKIAPKEGTFSKRKLADDDDDSEKSSDTGCQELGKLNINTSKTTKEREDEEIPRNTEEEPPKVVESTKHVPEVEVKDSATKNIDEAVQDISAQEEGRLEYVKPLKKTSDKAIGTRSSSSDSNSFSTDSLERPNVDASKVKKMEQAEENKMQDESGMIIDPGINQEDAPPHHSTSASSSISEDSLERGLRGHQGRVVLRHEIANLPGPSGDHRVVMNVVDSDSSDYGVHDPQRHRLVIEVEVHAPPVSHQDNVEGTEKIDSTQKKDSEESSQEELKVRKQKMVHRLQQRIPKQVPGTSRQSSDSNSFSEDSLEKVDRAQGTRRPKRRMIKKVEDKNDDTDKSSDSGFQVLDPRITGNTGSQELHQLLGTPGRSRSSSYSFSEDSLERDLKERVVPGTSGARWIPSRKQIYGSDTSSEYGCPPGPSACLLVVEAEVHKQPTSPKADMESADKNKNSESGARAQKKRRTTSRNTRKKIADLEEISLLKEEDPVDKNKFKRGGGRGNI